MKRKKAWVGWMDKKCSKGSHYPFCELHHRKQEGFVPVIVTPLLPGDPKVGEVWEHVTAKEVTILSPPISQRNGGFVVLVEDSNSVYWATGLEYLLRPKPALKTFRVAIPKMWSHIQAESREAALAKLAEALEEVE